MIEFIGILCNNIHFCEQNSCIWMRKSLSLCVLYYKYSAMTTEKGKLLWWTTSCRSFLLLTNNIKNKQNNEDKNYGIIRNDLQPDELQCAEPGL